MYNFHAAKQMCSSSQTIAELETALVSWQNDEGHSKHRSTKKSEKEKHKEREKSEKDHGKDHGKDSGKEGGAIFGIKFKRCKFTPLISTGSSHCFFQHTITILVHRKQAQNLARRCLLSIVFKPPWKLLNPNMTRSSSPYKLYRSLTIQIHPQHVVHLLLPRPRKKRKTTALVILRNHICRAVSTLLSPEGLLGHL